MPFVREIRPSDGITAGIWHINETAVELRSLLHLNEDEQNHYASFKHELRKKHWLAYRTLLSHLLAPIPSEISYDENGKPHLNSGSGYISVSHAGDYAAAVYSRKYVVGIDIEQMKDRVERVKERFLVEKELESLSTKNRLEHLYLHWCGKEALYKLIGKPDVDFRNGIYIHPYDYLCNTKLTSQATVTINNLRQNYNLYHEKIEDYMLVVAY